MGRKNFPMHAFEKFALAAFVVLTGWWAVLFFIFGGTLEQQSLYWAATYQLLAWAAAFFGFYIAKPWGGFNSLFGRGLIFFALGVVLQGVGQTTFSVYTTLLGVELPYPSFADVGYFGSVIFYLLGIYSIARVAGVGFKLKELGNQVIAFVVPLLLLVGTYILFLQDYDATGVSLLQVILDFGYPLGEALYVAIAILVLILSRNILGGIMRGPLIFLTIALITQYVAEFNFLYQAYFGIWINGGYGDMVYLLAYLMMAVSFGRIAAAFKAHTGRTT